MKKAILFILFALMVNGPAFADDLTVIKNTLKDKTVEDLSGPVKPNTSLGPPDLTTEIVDSVLEDLKDPASVGGLHKIAVDHGCSLSQVKLIESERQKKLGELQTAHAEMLPK